MTLSNTPLSPHQLNLTLTSLPLNTTHDGNPPSVQGGGAGAGAGRSGRTAPRPQPSTYKP